MPLDRLSHSVGEFHSGCADKEFRPAAVGTTCRDVAKRRREIDNAGINPEVINRLRCVITGFEQMGAIAETKGNELILQEATAAHAFVIKIAKTSTTGDSC